MRFILGQPLALEESLVCEFKEVRGSDPIQAIGKSVDEYAVAFLNASGGSIYWGVRDEDRVVVGLELNPDKRDKLRQVVGQKIAAIAPPVLPNSVDLPFHQVLRTQSPHAPENDVYVVEVAVRAPQTRTLYLTGSGEAYRKTLGGKVRLSGSELLSSLLLNLRDKQESQHRDNPEIWGPLTDFVPSVARRAEVVAPLINGARILWVDDIPSHTLFERTAFSALGVAVDVAVSSEEAFFMLDRLKPDLIISDIWRGAKPEAGLDFLDELRTRQIATPVIFYIGQLDHSKPMPIGSFGITNMVGELFHLTFDVLERRRSAPA